MRQHASLKDVARESGVSFQTASKALNNTGSVAPATRARVITAARELGYVPNALARGLVNQNTALIGVIASDMSQSVLTLPVAGVEREAQRQGFNVIIGSVSPSGDTSASVVQTLLERRVDGIILIAPMLEEDPEIVALSRGRTPVVSTHDTLDGAVPVVKIDEVQLGIDATSHLLSLGHTCIATIVGDPHRHVSRYRLDGYTRALAGSGIALDRALIEDGGWDVERAYQATHRLMDRSPRPTAIVAHNDTMAIGVLAALHDRGLHVPDDCAVIGCDDLPVSARTIPPLTTFNVPFERIGQLAVQRLATCIADRGSAERDTYLTAPLVYRASTGRPRAEPHGATDDPTHVDTERSNR